MLGDMRDLDAFPDDSFDVVIVNPVSNVFCPGSGTGAARGVPRASPRGVLLAGFCNPDIFIFDVTALDERWGEFEGAPPAAVQHARLRPKPSGGAATGTARSSTAIR